MSASTPKVSELFEQRYELLELLGAGGIGSVFKARQIEANRFIALKVLHSSFAEDEEFKTRFLREAQSLNKLRHPNIVTIYHLGLSAASVPYLVMELIEGTTLRHLLVSERRLKPTRAIAIAKQLCAALACMHEQGIVHRDLKPENIVLMQEPEPDFVKIIDFGLVQVEGESEKQKLTSTGLVIGSVNYMSPEQCRGVKVDFHSDLYALTVCFFEMLTGRCPFIADTPVGIMYKHTNETTPKVDATTVNNYHPAINDFLQKGMQKDPAARFQSANEMSDALDKLSDSLSGGTPWVDDYRFRQVAIALALTAVLALIVVIGVAISRGAHKDKKQLANSVMPANKLRTKIDLDILDDRELAVVAADKKEDDYERLDANLRYAFLHRKTKDGMMAAQEANRVYCRHRGGWAISGIDDRVRLVQAETFAFNGASEDEMQFLAAPPPGRKAAPQHMQEQLRADSLRAYVYSTEGKKKETAAILKKVCDWDYGLRLPGSIFAISAAFRINRLDYAKRIAGQVTRLYEVAEISQFCREHGHPEIAALAMDHGLIYKSETVVMHVNMAASRLTSGDFLFEIEQCWLDMYRNNYESARKRLLGLLNDANQKQTLHLPDCQLPMLLAMREAGLIQEALKLAGARPISPELRLLHADLLVIGNDIDGATKLVESDTQIIDPETKKTRPALDRLRDLKEGRADHNKGLNYWAGSLKR